jgi:predicted Rossmann fold nucleotide-binding protein DprA/Smf involved in DNA uptake
MTVKLNPDDTDQDATSTDRNSNYPLAMHHHHNPPGVGMERAQSQSSTTAAAGNTTTTTTKDRGNFTAWKRKKDSKIVGLKHYGLDSPRHQLQNHHQTKHRLFAVEQEEELVRKNVAKNPFVLFYLGNLAAIKVIIYYFSTYS